MNIHIPASIGLILLGLSLVALLFIGYQLDDIYRRIKDLESNHDALSATSMTTVNLLCTHREDITNLQESLMSFEERIKNSQKEYIFSSGIPDGNAQLIIKPKGKVGRPKKVKSE